MLRKSEATGFYVYFKRTIGYIVCILFVISVVVITMKLFIYKSNLIRMGYDVWGIRLIGIANTI